MPAPVKRFLIIVLVLLLSFGSAKCVDGIIDRYERNKFPLGDSDSMRNAVSKYSEEYNVPEKVIYTVICVRSGGNRNFGNQDRVGYFGLSESELLTVGKLLHIDITYVMAKNPSYNLLFGVTYLKYLYSSFGDWNSVYAALLCGRDEVLQWGSDKKLTDVTGALVALPNGNAHTDDFLHYLEVEKKYVSLYFSEKSFDETVKKTDETSGQDTNFSTVSN